MNLSKILKEVRGILDSGKEKAIETIDELEVGDQLLMIRVSGDQMKVIKIGLDDEDEAIMLAAYLHDRVMNDE